MCNFFFHFELESYIIFNNVNSNYHLITVLNFIILVFLWKVLKFAQMC